MAITLDEVKHIASLANLEFTPGEHERFARQLSAILEYVEQLNRIDTSAIEATSHLGSGSHALRDDLLRDSMPRDQALANAPAAEHGLFKVPKVIG